MDRGSPEPQTDTSGRREQKGSRRPLFVVIGWAVLIFGSSMTVILWQPFVQAVGSRFGPDGVAKFEAFWLNWWWLFVKGWHVTEFFVLFLVIHRFLKNRMPFREALAWTAFATLLYAALDEFHQTFVDLRGGRIEDVMIDLIGITAAFILITARERRASK
jgi:hypothetical protein